MRTFHRDSEFRASLNSVQSCDRCDRTAIHCQFVQKLFTTPLGEHSTKGSPVDCRCCILGRWSVVTWRCRVHSSVRKNGTPTWSCVPCDPSVSQHCSTNLTYCASCERFDMKQNVHNKVAELIFINKRYKQYISYAMTMA